MKLMVMHSRKCTCVLVELVTLRLEDDINPHEITGKYLEPKDFYEAMKQEDTVIIDARNDYEFDLGHFKGAIKPDIESFRELQLDS